MAISRHYPLIFLEEPWKVGKIIRHVNRFTCPESKIWCPEYSAEILIVAA
jgi:hypothetical protein